MKLDDPAVTSEPTKSRSVGSPEFESEFAALYPRLLRFARVCAPSGVDAADLVQEALARMLGRSPVSRRVRDPEAYLVRSMANIAVTDRRRSRRFLAGHRREQHVPEDTTSLGDDVVQMLKALPARQRACLYLRFVEDRSVRATAELLGCTMGTVKSQTAKALAHIRRNGLVGDDRQSEVEWS